MSLELLSTAATIGTLLVIAVTAIAAVIQLRHLRAGNQVASVHSFVMMYEGPELADTFHIVRSELARRLEEPVFRRELRTSPVLDQTSHPEIAAINAFEQWGSNYRYGALDRNVYLQLLSRVFVSNWTLLEPAIALMSERSGGANIVAENVEYFVVESRDWMRRHPHGTYLAGLSVYR